MRAVFHERDEAVAVVAALRRQGFEADLARERFAGEDDDEDHPWAVLTDAPGFVVEILAEQYDGWVDPDDPHEPIDPAAPAAPPSGVPLDLPSAPRRIKGHFQD